ncbi:MAG: acyl--CoA ligase [Beijerinckiaceae bacterium]|nr:acyl--CoA ligase [Beijerinckiaceae bacterium]MCI0600285.1 acyl--CoA ligase [Beijerinckiaceae bacterium]MCI0735937.1 acyl--CoA ligase [Beijerinckiaceae bacterium]
MNESASLSRLLRSGLRLRPDKAAIVFEGHTYTYGMLERRVSALAASFAASGLTGERIGLMLPNSIDLVCCYLACFRAGAIAAPVSHNYAAPELARALGVAEPRWLIFDAAHRGLIAGLDMGASGIERVVIAGGGEDQFSTLLNSGTAYPAGDEPPEQPALIFFTSGSTGKPKGVLHTHRSALAILTSTCEALDGVDASDRILVCEPQVHPSGFIATFSVLSRGGTIGLLSGFDEASYIAGLRSIAPGLIVTHIDILAKLLRAPEIRREDFAALRGVYTGGDVVPPALQRQFLAFTGLPIQVGWGMTEAIWLTVCRDPGAERQGCIGRPASGVEIRISGEDGHALGDGETGEFWVKGPMVMREYWRDPEATARAFDNGWFRTGDSGSRDADGNYWFAARIKDIIVRNTAKLTPGEVEAALSQHPGIKYAAVIGVPDPDEGEVPAAFIVPEPDRLPSAEALTRFLESRIARYKIPARYYFLSALPLTRSGKIDHNALRAMPPASSPKA